MTRSQQSILYSALLLLCLKQDASGQWSPCRVLPEAPQCVNSTKTVNLPEKTRIITGVVVILIALSIIAGFYFKKNIKRCCRNFLGNHGEKARLNIEDKSIISTTYTECPRGSGITDADRDRMEEDRLAACQNL